MGMAKGPNPVKAVQWLDRIAHTTETEMMPTSCTPLPHLAAHAYISADYRPAKVVPPPEASSANSPRASSGRSPGVSTDTLLPHPETLPPAIGELLSTVPAVPPGPPQLFFLVSGKRCTGKDYIANQLAPLANRLCKNAGGCKVMRLADSVKEIFAMAYDLDFDRLISMERQDRDYKEQYRTSLTGFFKFFRPSLQWVGTSLLAKARQPMPNQSQPPSVIVISDLRHPSELKWLQQQPSVSRVLTMRVEASETTRIMRGYQFDSEKDSDATETAFDHFQGWDLRCDNNPHSDPGHLAKFMNSQVLSLLISHARY